MRYEAGKLHTQHVSEVLFSANYNSPARPKQKVAGYCHYDERTFFFFFSAIRARKNITSCWTGVCFPAKCFTTSGCDTRSVKGEHPPTTGFLLRPLWWLSVSQPAHQPGPPSGQNRQSTSQPVTQPEIKPVDQLVSCSESVTAWGGLAHSARSVMKKEDVHYSQVPSHGSLQLLDCSHGGDSSMLVRARFRV